MIVLLWSILALHLLTLLWMIRVRRQMPSLESVKGASADLPLLSVILPMRNERTNAEAALAVLMGQDHPNLEIIVVDDGSDDGTGEILRRTAGDDPRVRVIEGQELPEGWRGKNYALWQGCKAAQGEEMLLIDADVRLAPTTLRLSCLAMASRGASMLTLLPRLVTGATWEHAVQTAIMQVFISWLPIDDIEDMSKPFSLANGPFILLTREAYEGIGGHEALKAEIAEDYIMALRLKQMGFKPTYWDGSKHMDLRMYETFRGLWQGWTKNFYFGLGQSVVLALFFAAFILGYFVLPYAAFLWFLVGSLMGFASVAGLALSGAVLLCRRITRQLFGVFYGMDGGRQHLEPFGFLVMVALIGNSFARYLLVGEVEWRGRTHQVSK